MIELARAAVNFPGQPASPQAPNVFQLNPHGYSRNIPGPQGEKPRV
jgi:hypothetical protein